MHENIVPGRELVRGRDLHTKKWSPKAKREVLKNILKTNDLLSDLMFHIQAFVAGSEQQNCSNAM